jgi:hypothetical protein
MDTEQKLQFLQACVERYLEAPGCNNQSRITAIEKLRWALEETRKESGNG